MLSNIYTHIPRLWVTLRNISARPVVNGADVGIRLPARWVSERMGSLANSSNKHSKLGNKSACEDVPVVPRFL